jgi:putative transcriptional regulator
MRTGQLLVATPTLLDPHFVRTVVLILQADADEGAVGVVLNRPSGTAVEEVLPGWADLAASPPLVFSGGPVEPAAAICLGRAASSGRRPGCTAAFAALDGDPGGAVGTVDLAAAPGDLAGDVTQVRVFAGYAGWTSGQLEAEVAEGAWWVLDSLPADAFDSGPELLWQRVLRRQGPPVAFAATFPDDPTLN